MANLGQRLLAPESAQGALFLAPCDALESFIRHSAAKMIRKVMLKTIVEERPMLCVYLTGAEEVVRRLQQALKAAQQWQGTNEPTKAMQAQQ